MKKFIVLVLVLAGFTVGRFTQSTVARADTQDKADLAEMSRLQAIVAAKAAAQRGEQAIVQVSDDMPNPKGSKAPTRLELQIADLARRVHVMETALEVLPITNNEIDRVAKLVEQKCGK